MIRADAGKFVACLLVGWVAGQTWARLLWTPTWRSRAPVRAIDFRSIFRVSRIPSFPDPEKTR